MNYLVVGDTHGVVKNLIAVYEYAVKNKCVRIIQTGDFGCYPNLEEFHEFLQTAEDLAKLHDIKLDFIGGNHENWEYLRGLKFPFAISPNVKFIPNGSCWIFPGSGKKVLFCGGAHTRDGIHRLRGIDWFPEELISNADYYKCIEHGEVDIMFCHDRPALVSKIIGWDFDDETSEKNALVLDEIFKVAKPKQLFHGHFHKQYFAHTHGCNIIGLAGHEQPITEQCYILEL